jgi:hypothetical protein
MGHHFGNAFRFNPTGYKRSEDKVWNTFVVITHMIGLTSFKFTPTYYDPRKISGGPKKNIA